MRKGYDIVFRDPGTVESENCSVCKAVMNVRRNVKGPISFAGAMAGSSYFHDQFACPNAGSDWHEQAIALMNYIEATPSRAIEKIVKKELDQILKKRKATKKLSFF